MLKNALAVLMAVLTLFSACKNQDCCKTDAAGGAVKATENSATAGKTFGAAITSDGAMAFDEMVVKMAASDSMPAKVVGKIEAVCQVKGCWMDFVSDDPAKPKMKVKFKDYAFFMPLDCAGKRAVVDGYAYTQTTDVAELKHLAEDAGKSKEEIAAITEPKKELRFMASGVVFVD